MLSAAQMAHMSQLLEIALELDVAGRRSWLGALAPEYEYLLPALRRALLPEDDGASRCGDLPSIAAAVEAESLRSGLQPGDTIGPYRLIRSLGIGGMAEVWLAQRADGALKRDVALKLPLLARLRNDLAGRFQRERDILATLVHPNIARLYDAGVSRDGLPYLAMEYIVGKPLTTYCDEHRLSVRARLALFQQVLSAVRYAHANLVIHRDIKPSNILVTEVGHVQLLDFGIAKILSEGEAKETQLTRLAGRALTPDYAAPEQIRGTSVTIAADVYALGVVLYEILTGNRPYRLKRDSLGALEEAILQTEPVPPSHVRPDETSAGARATTATRLPKVLAGDLDAMVMKALKKSPEKRYGTATEFADDVARYLRGDVVLAQPDSTAYHFIKFVRRNRAVVAAVSVLILTLAAGLAATSWEARVAAHQRDAALQAQVRSLTQTAAARLNSADVVGASGVILEVLTNRSIPLSYTADALNVFQEARAADSQVLSTTVQTGLVVSAQFSPDGRRFVTASTDKTARVWDAASARELLALNGHKDRVRSAAFSPDGQRIVTASWDKTARVWDSTSGRQLLVISGHTDRVASAAFSPDGRRIVTASFDKTARVWDAVSGQQLLLLNGSTEDMRSAAFSPDGRRIVTASWDKTARVWDSDSGKQLLVLNGHTGVLISAAFSPDGRRIATASFDKTARIWDSTTGQQLLVLIGHTGEVESAAFSPDGRLIATTSLDETVRIWDGLSAEQLRVLSGHTGEVESVGFSPDGRRIVTASFDGTARIWDVESRRQLLVLAGHTDALGSAAFSPDGQQIVTTSFDKTARVWDVARGHQLHVLGGHTGLVVSGTFSPDKQYVATVSYDRTARIWNAHSAEQLRLLSGHTEAVHHVAISPDGQRIVTASDDKTARVWDAAKGQQLLELIGHTERVMGADFSPDGQRIVTASYDKTARIWDAVSGQQLRVLTGHKGEVVGAAFSPDGRRIATASFDKTARIWDAVSGQELLVLSGHTERVWSAVFSRDGRRVATASDDKTARIWDSASGQQLLVLLGHRDFVERAEFSPDGGRIVTASLDKTARIWDARVVDLDAQIAWAQAAQFDPLSSTERFQLGLPLPSNVRRWAADVSNCDQTAAAPYDPLRRASGVMLEEMVVDVATPACAESESSSNSAARFVYQRGRTLMAKGDSVGARREFERALDAGYPAAGIDLAMLLSHPSRGMLNIQRAISLFEGAWKAGVPIAAFELGSLYEHGAREIGSNRYLLVPDDARAWSWYQKGAEAGEPSALARYGQKEDGTVLTGNNSSGRVAHLIQAFQYYASAAERARVEDWPDAAWRNWRYRRASIARQLALEGMTEQVAAAYGEALTQHAPRTGFWERVESLLGMR